METRLDKRYGEENATATAWEDARERVRAAGVSWLTTLRADGRPHITPLLTVWLADAVYFCTGPEEQKARNLTRNPQCALTTGTSALHNGLDVVLEGAATLVRDEALLTKVAAAYVGKYGEEWRFRVQDGGLVNNRGMPVQTYELAPVTGYGFAKGPYGQTRWRF